MRVLGVMVCSLGWYLVLGFRVDGNGALYGACLLGFVVRAGCVGFVICTYGG